MLASLCLNWVRIQEELYLMSTASYFVSSHKVPMPPEAPLELMAALPLFFQNLVLVWRNASSSILVSWIRRMSRWCKDIRSDIDSSLDLLPRPLQFQERTFITYFWRSKASLSGHAPDDEYSLYFSAAFPRLAETLAIYPCR